MICIQFCNASYAGSHSGGYFCGHFWAVEESTSTVP